MRLSIRALYPRRITAVGTVGEGEERVEDDFTTRWKRGGYR